MPDLAIQVQVVKSLANTAVVILNGSIDAKTVITFQTHLNSVKERGINRFILDMENIKYVNSTGLGYLINLSDSLGSDQSGGITLVKVQPKVKVVFDMLGLNAFFKIFTTRDEALKAFMSEPVISTTEPTIVMKSVHSEPSRSPAGTAVAEQPAVAQPAPPRSVSPPLAEKLHIECASCKALLAVEAPGTYKCPRCFSLFNYSGNGKANFLPKRKGPPLHLSLNFDRECTEGLLEFVKRMAHKSGFSNGGVEEMQTAVRETVDTLYRFAYGGNENNIYHVQLLAADSELELRFADYGSSIALERTDQNGQRVFDRVRGLVDRFDLKHHPKGGNFVVVAKTVGK